MIGKLFCWEYRFGVVVKKPGVEGSERLLTKKSSSLKFTTLTK